jgi:hypothetical protein
MLAEGGVDPGMPLKWNNRRLVCVLPTSLSARHAALWQFMVGEIWNATSQVAARLMKLSRAVRLVIGYRR